MRTADSSPTPSTNFRGYPDPRLLAQLPGEKIFAVQLTDAGAAVQGGSLYADQMRFREASGDGEFPLGDHPHVALDRRLDAGGTGALLRRGRQPARR